MKIGVFVGSTRRGRKGDQVGSWIASHAAEHLTSSDVEATVEVIDLADFNLPFFDSETHPAMANKQYEDEATQAWSAVIDSYDAYIFVTPEYNHSVPAAMKNAFDSLFSEWAKKPVAFAGYGASGGIRSVEHWRVIVGNVFMFDTRSQMTVFLDSDFVDNVFTPAPILETSLKGMVDELIGLTHMSKALQVSA